MNLILDCDDWWLAEQGASGESDYKDSAQITITQSAAPHRVKNIFESNYANKLLCGYVIVNFV